MRAITIRSLETKTHPEIKRLLWYVFASTKGGITRVKIMSHLKNTPSNKHQLAKKMGLDYKSIEHHIKTLEKNNLVTKVGNNYGVTYFPSILFEEGHEVFDEIVSRLNKVGDR